MLKLYESVAFLFFTFLFFIFSSLLPFFFTFLAPMASCCFSRGVWTWKDYLTDGRDLAS